MVVTEPLINQVRIEQTRRELEILRDDVKNRLKERRDKDVLHRYHTQLTNLQQVLTDSLATLEASIAEIDQSASPGKVYGTCRYYDEGLLLLRRILTYYQHKF